MAQKKYKATQPYGGINAEERQVARRETFVEAGLEAFGTTGYTRSTIKSICEIAGLTQRYFYESFQDKEDLLVAVYRKLISDLEDGARTILERSDLSPEDKGHQILCMFFQRFKDNPRRAQVQLFEVLGVSSRVDKEYQSAMLNLADWIKLFMTIAFPGFQDKYSESTVVYNGVAGAIIQIAHQWTLDGLVMPMDEIVDQIFNMVSALGKYYSDLPKNVSSVSG